MDHIEYLIRHETENTSLDFKAIQYKKSQFEAFLKDVISMANAVSSVDKYIIVGVNLKSSGKRDFVGIDKDKFIDSSTYQQLVYENIEPHIQFDYSPFEIDGITLGIFHFFNTSDKPYLMKKDYGKLKKGESFIRRGDSQDRLVRSDIDLIYDERISANDFDSHVMVGFDFEDFPTTITLPTFEPTEIPSEKTRKNIEGILQKKKTDKNKRDRTGTDKNFKKSGNKGLFLFEDMAIRRSILYPFGGAPYEHRTIEELEEALTKVDEWYYDDDLYFMFEENSNKINLRILNNADSYIEDASFQLIFPKIKGMLIADKIYSKPQDNSILPISPEIPLLDDYPVVEENESEIIISTILGDIKHRIPESVLGDSVRILFAKDLVGHKIEVKSKLFGKNLREPIIRNLMIEVVSLQQ
jgi:hypothetical protein